MAVIVMIECRACGESFRVFPEEVADPRNFHCINCGRLVMMPRGTGETRTPLNLSPQAKRYATELTRAGNEIIDRAIAGAMGADLDSLRASYCSRCDKCLTEPQTSCPVQPQ